MQFQSIELVSKLGLNPKHVAKIDDRILFLGKLLSRSRSKSFFKVHRRGKYSWRSQVRADKATNLGDRPDRFSSHPDSSLFAFLSTSLKMTTLLAYSISDGTTNFIHSNPNICTILAFMVAEVGTMQARPTF